MAKCPASAFQENTDDDQGPEDYQKQGGLIGARQTARQIEPLPPFFQATVAKPPSMYSISLPPTLAHRQRIREGASPQAQHGKKICACRRLKAGHDGESHAQKDLV
jgi:hypothetical protein